MKNLAVLGSPISHSKSPLIMLAALKHLGVEATFDIVELPSGLAAWMQSSGRHYDCLSVTIPLKPEANQFAISLDAASKATGATNCLIKTDEGYLGFNTDALGLLKAVAGFEFKTVAVLGTGATAKTALYAFREFQTLVWGRNQHKAQALASEYGASPTSFDQATSADLVISTLPIGVLPDLIDGMTGSILLDIAYTNTDRSNFRVKISGVEMLIWQGIGQLRHLLNAGKEFEDEQILHDLMLRAVKMEE